MLRSNVKYKKITREWQPKRKNTVYELSLQYSKSSKVCAGATFDRRVVLLGLCLKVKGRFKRLPVQINPSPVYPVRHVHWKDPSVLVQ